MYVCEHTCTPISVSECSPPGSLSPGQGGEGQGRGKSEGPRDGREPAANDGRVESHQSENL